MDARSRWESRTEVPLTVIAFVFLAAYAVPIIWPELPLTVHMVCAVISWATWVLFLVDYLARLAMATARWQFVRATWFDLVILVMPMLRPVRALRATVALSVLGRRGGHFARGRVVASVSGAVVLVAFVASLAVLEAERDVPDAHIRSFGDAIWWAAATVTTVGYGDLTPVTAEGRMVALVLMVTGIGLLGVITAALASWFVEKVGEVEAVAERTETDVQQLMAEMRRLRELVESLGGPQARESPRGGLPLDT